MNTTKQDICTHDVDVGGERQCNSASLLGDVHTADQPSSSRPMSQCSDDGQVDGGLLQAAAQIILSKGYLPRIVQKAIDRIHEKHGPTHEITDQCLLGEIGNLQRELNLPDASLKRPTNAIADNQHNMAMPEGLEELRQQNQEMRRLLVCKSCDTSNVSHVITNCGHMICESCIRLIKKCFHCGVVIERVQIVRIGNNV